MYFKRLCTGFILASITMIASADNSIWAKSYKEQAQGQLQQAVNTLQPMIKKNNEFALMRYAYLEYLQGRYNESISIYENVIDLNPASIDAKLAITLPLMAQLRWRQVKHYSLEVLKLSHWNYSAHVKLMIAEEGMRNWKTLEKHAAQLAKTYPTDSTALVYLARANAWQGEIKQANSVYKEVLIRVPGHIEASNYLKNN